MDTELEVLQWLAVCNVELELIHKIHNIAMVVKLVSIKIKKVKLNVKNVQVDL